MVIIRQCFKGRSNLWEAYEIATENDKPRAEGLQEVGFERRIGGAGKDKTPEGAIPTGVLLNELAWQ